MSCAWIFRTTLSTVVDVTADLSHFVQRREVLAYETRLARTLYAYGVDSRRMAWLDHSTLGEPLLRTVDRHWADLLKRLGDEVLQPTDQAAPTALLEELTRLIRLLRAPVPAVRLLRGNVDHHQWPTATPLGATKGGAFLLLLDADRLMALPATARTVHLATALAHLQCEHGPVIVAHLLAHLAGRSTAVIRRLLRPWSSASVFSADRAALLATNDLDATCDAIQNHDVRVSWWPPTARLEVRLQALQDFDRSRVMAQLRLTEASRSEWSLIEDQASSPSEANQSNKRRWITRLGPLVLSVERPKPEPESAAPASDDHPAPASDDHPAPASDDPPESDPVKEAEAMADDVERDRDRQEATEEQEAEAKRVEETLLNAWSLARCDARLTRRLGLL